MKKRIFIYLLSFFLGLGLFANMVSAVDLLSLNQSKLFFALTSLQSQAECNLPPLKVMLLGDSITYGSGTEAGYRLSLWNSLSAGNLPIDFVGSQARGPATIDRDHEGHPGKAIQYFQEEISGWIEAYHPNIILLMVGTNNILYPQIHDFAGASNRLDALIQQITEIAPETELFIASVPVLKDPEANARARLFNAEIPGIVATYMSQGKRVHYVDMYSVLTPLDLADGVHPNVRGYGKIADVWYNALARFLEPASFYSLAAQNYPDRFIRHSDSQVRLTSLSTEQDKQDATFKLVPGLTGSGISFESVNYPDHFLRHRRFDVWLDPFNSNTLWQSFSHHATFKEIQGLGDHNLVSFESLAYPNSFLRQFNFRIFLGQGDSQSFQDSATFRLVPAEYRPPPQVVMALPDNDTFTQQLDSPIMLIFDQAMDTATISDQTISIRAYPDGQEHIVAGKAYFIDPNKIVFCPNHGYPTGTGNTPVTLTLSGIDTGNGIVKSSLGMPLDGNGDGTPGGDYVLQFQLGQ
jgi:lysophospholipase L1-like esterase